MRRTPPRANREIEGLRGARNPLDPKRPYAFLIEPENFGGGRVAEVATIFLTNRECRWRCLMCDLWRNTLAEALEPGLIPRQIDFAFGRLGLGGEVGGAGSRPPVSGLKLYNSGSFFDARAIPVADHPAIAARAAAFERLIVECHPSLVSRRILPFVELLRNANPQSRFEVAMGLETAHPEVLARLNKGMTLDDFARAARFLGEVGVALRAFVLVKPPFLTEDREAALWAARSIEFAFESGAEVVSLIPTRGGNGALEALAARGEFEPPRLALLEEALDYGLSLGAGRVFADLWDLERFADCPACFERRRARLEEINLTQRPAPRFVCPECR